VTMFVAQAQLRHQRMVLEALTLEDIGHFLPKVRSTRVVNGRKVEFLTSLFGRYFFVEAVERWRDLFALRNFGGFLMSSKEDSHPSPVCDSIVSLIRDKCDAGGVMIEDEVPAPLRLRRGQWVRPRSGALVDMIGTYAGRCKNREDALFVLLGRQVSVSFVDGILEAV
jgi:transcription antitermination factor NusG